MTRPSVSMTRRVLLALLAVLAVAFAAYAFPWARRANPEARRQEARVMALLKDERVSTVGLQVPRNGLTGLLTNVCLDGPWNRRGERALMAVNPIDPQRGHTRLFGPTIDACRVVPDGVPAEILPKNPIPVPDVYTLFGPYSAHTSGDYRRLKDVDYYTYGELDVGIKNGELIVVRVR